MALVKPGDVEWGSITFSVRASAGTGYWFTSATRREGWQPTWSAQDLPTIGGASPGIAIPDPMYPTLFGVAVNTAAQAVALLSAMDPSGGTGTLTWWDRERDVVLSATALPRRCEMSTAPGSQHLGHRLADLMWMIPRPADIEEVEEEEEP